MGIISFKIDHNKLTEGPFPKEEMEAIDGITIDIERNGPFKEIVTITIDNCKEEDEFALVYTIGTAVQSCSNFYKAIN